MILPSLDMAEEFINSCETEGVQFYIDCDGDWAMLNYTPEQELCMCWMPQEIAAVLDKRGETPQRNHLRLVVCNG